MIFTLFLPKPPVEAVKMVRAMFNVLLGWLAHENVTAYLVEKQSEEEEDE